MAVGGFFVLIVGVAVVANFQDSSSPSGETSAPKPENKEVTMAKYEAVTTGMSYAEVVEIIGFEGESLSVVEVEGLPKTEVFMWGNSSGSNMNATFQGDEVVSKAQFGLK